MKLLLILLIIENGNLLEINVSALMIFFVLEYNIVFPLVYQSIGIYQMSIKYLVLFPNIGIIQAFF